MTRYKQIGHVYDALNFDFENLSRIVYKMSVTTQFKSVRELQNYLRDRGVVYGNSKKHELIDLCELANEVKIQVDPDGLIEDRDEILEGKLSINNNTDKLQNPQLLIGSPDISSVPCLSIFDIYNYLISTNTYDHSSLREYHKLEGYTMFKDGYVMDITSATYDQPGKFIHYLILLDLYIYKSILQ